MKLFDKLDARCPQGYTTAGATLFFKRNLTAREVRRAFELFPIIAGLETPAGYYLRENIKECYHDPASGAHRINAAVVRECQDSTSYPLSQPARL